MNSTRLWAVVNFTANQVFFSSFDYLRSKAVYDKCVKPFTDSNGNLLPNLGDICDLRLVRYDINRSYVDDNPRISPFQKSLNDDFRAFMDFCLLKRGSKHTQTTKQEILKCYSSK